MSRYAKYCQCGTENAVYDATCLGCGADIIDIPTHKIDSHVVDTDKEAPTASLTTALTVQNHGDVNICPACGATNPAYLDFCTCGIALEAISSPVAPRSEVAENKSASKKSSNKKLIIVVGNQQFECKDGDVLGRVGTVACQIFSGIGTVSGRHVSVQLRSGEWWLTNLPLQPGKDTKNATIVAGRELSIGASVRLTGDTMLQMSTKCTVTLRVV